MARFKIVDHWLDMARKVPSENYDNRPVGDEINLIVIHCISLPPGVFGGDEIDRLFQNRLRSEEHPYFASIQQLKVSAHVLIRRSAEVTQYVSFNRRAWHAGQSSYQGRTNCNDYSVGIELEGTDDSPFMDRQYARLASLILSLIDHYPALSCERIVGHQDIAPGRKTDPGTQFDWERLYGLIKQDPLAKKAFPPGGSK